MYQSECIYEEHIQLTLPRKYELKMPNVLCIFIINVR